MHDDVPQVRLVTKDLDNDLAVWPPLAGLTMERELDRTVNSPGRDRIGSLQDRISGFEASEHRLRMRWRPKPSMAATSVRKPAAGQRFGAQALQLAKLANPAFTR